MRIDPVQIQPKQSLVYDYRNNFDAVKEKFEYPPFESSTWEQRLAHLQERSFQREELVQALRQMNDRWQAPEASFANIERLKEPESTVVIAGQQAGLLTGPLYTVHKIISVLQLAKQKEAELDRSVVPVFWIAGEDHDFDEINHVMMKSEGRMKKVAIQQQPSNKSSVSDTVISQEDGLQWLRDIFQEVEEREHTQQFYQETVELLKQSESYSDFFAMLVYRLFPNEGIVMVDAHDQALRNLESGYFSKMVDHNLEISQGVYVAQQQSRQQGYETLLNSESSDAHLFYHDGDERILLTRDGNNMFRGKRNEIVLTTEDLKSIAENEPHRLSNNVVTRPLMQEFVFPVLAFIGGPGEISYWSALKPAFDCLDLKMPPVLPRLSFTLLDRKAEQNLQQLQLNPSRVVQYGTGEEKVRWLASMTSPPIQHISAQVKSEIDRIHEPLRDKAAELGPDLEGVSEKNLQYIFQHIDYLEKRLSQSLEDQYEKEVSLFDELDLLVHPNRGLQERIWNLTPWVNEYGKDVFSRMNQHHYSFEHTHFLVYV